MSAHRAGYVALVGRPNVGKSSLLNALLGRKVSIVTPRPQTTRRRVMGVLTTDDAQLVFFDTPGLHGGGRRRLNRVMNEAARSALADADVVLVVVDVRRLDDADRSVLAAARESGRPVVVALNKIDLVRPRQAMLPRVEAVAALCPGAELVPVSARRRENTDQLVSVVAAVLPECEALYPPETITDSDEPTQIAEIIREKLMLHLQDELPYGIAVHLERFDASEQGLVHAGAVIWVEQERHKAIVIGRQGRMLKTVGSAARHELEKLLERKVYLELWVKVRADWADDDAALREAGYLGQ